MFDYLMALIEKDVYPPSKKKHDEKESGKGRKNGKREKKTRKGKEI